MLSPGLNSDWIIYEMLRAGASSPLNPVSNSLASGRKGDCWEDLCQDLHLQGECSVRPARGKLEPPRDLTGWTGICPLTSFLLINLVSLLDGVYRHTGVCVSEGDLRREDVFLSVGSTILWAGDLDWMKKSTKLRSP